MSLAIEYHVQCDDKSCDASFHIMLPVTSYWVEANSHHMAQCRERGWEHKPKPIGGWKHLCPDHREKDDGTET